MKDHWPPGLPATPAGPAVPSPTAPVPQPQAGLGASPAFPIKGPGSCPAPSERPPRTAKQLTLVHQTRTGGDETSGQGVHAAIAWAPPPMRPRSTTLKCRTVPEWGDSRGQRRLALPAPQVGGIGGRRAGLVQKRGALIHILGEMGGDAVLPGMDCCGGPADRRPPGRKERKVTPMPSSPTARPVGDLGQHWRHSGQRRAGSAPSEDRGEGPGAPGPRDSGHPSPTAPWPNEPPPVRPLPGVSTWSPSWRESRGIFSL